MEKKEKNNPHQTMDFPQDFRCPISMEIMKEPVTISTGFTYERKNIEKWFFTYKKTTCPTTMQVIHNFDTTPNHTLKRLILAWQNSLSQSSSSPLPSPKHDELVSLLNTIEATPFKVSSLKKLRSIVETDDEMHDHVKKSGGSETSDFIAFRASEEALGVLHHFLLSEEDETKTIQMLSKPESVKSMALMLQRGSAEASFVLKDQGMDLFKSMLELASDEICTKASSCSLQVLIEILSSSKKSRLKAIEAGAICKIMQLIKLLCECAEGRLAFIEHGLGIAAVSKKMLHVSDVATKIGVKILWLICSFHHTERVVEEMLMFGAVKKLVALLHIGGRSSTKNKVVKILKLNVNSWRRYPCFPSELKKYLGLMNDSC
ncbi:hypothetical protein CsSME_00012182 [Camellia sinensis var. sinensis]